MAGSVGWLAMTPQAALDVQIARYTAMTPEQRVAIALRLDELACEIARLGIRRQHGPDLACGQTFDPNIIVEIHIPPECAW
jgi:hypothetical protein